MILKNLTMIAAIGQKNELGKRGDLVWHLRADLRHFRDTTMGKFIIMGEKTYESLPVVLKGRKYLVLSPNLKEIPEGKVFNTLESLLDFVKEANEEIFVCGGGMVYKLLLPYSSKMILTEIEATDNEADVFFPKFNRDEWKKQEGESQKENDIKFKINVYNRIGI